MRRENDGQRVGREAGIEASVRVVDIAGRSWAGPDQGRGGAAHIDGLSEA